MRIDEYFYGHAQVCNVRGNETIEPEIYSDCRSNEKLAAMLGISQESVWTEYGQFGCVNGCWIRLSVATN